MLQATDMIINVNDLKKGTEVVLRNGFTARLEDSKKGQTRLATVRGYYEEMGSIYATDIKYAVIEGRTLMVEYPDKYIKGMQMRKAMGF